MRHRIDTVNAFRIQISPNVIRSFYYFIQLHPQSYAGKYVPAIGYYIHKNNPSAKVKINFKGVAIGDGLCDPELVRFLKTFKKSFTKCHCVEKQSL